MTGHPNMVPGHADHVRSIGGLLYSNLRLLGHQVDQESCEKIAELVIRNYYPCVVWKEWGDQDGSWERHWLHASIQIGGHGYGVKASIRPEHLDDKKYVAHMRGRIVAKLGQNILEGRLGDHSIYES